jgi:hypothetical protein
MATDGTDRVNFHDENELTERIDGEIEENAKDRNRDLDRAVDHFRIKTRDTTDASLLFHANLINPQFRRQAALLTEMKPKLDVQPRREGLQQTANILRETINCIWDEQRFGMALERLVLMASVLRSSFCYIGWDAQANYGMGDVSLRVLDPRDVGVDPAITASEDLNFAQYIRTRTVVPLWKARHQFPEVADKLKAGGKIRTTDRPDQRRSGAVRGAIESAMGRLGMGHSERAMPSVELYEYYVVDPKTNKDKKAKWPNGKVIIKAPNDVICHSGPNIYYDGMWPLEWLDGLPDMEDPWGEDELTAIRRLQMPFNKLGNTMTKATLLNAIAIMVADKNALDPDAINALRKMGFYFIEKIAGRTFERQPAPVQIGTILQAMSYMQGLADNLAGLQDGAGNIGTSKGRAEVRSAPMLEGLQQAGQVLIRARARRFEAFLERVGQKLISRIFQFMTQDRLMSQVGSSGEFKQYEFQRQKLQGEILQLALKRVNTSREQRLSETKGKADAGDSEAQTSLSTLDFYRNLKSLDTLPVDGEEGILTAVKGAWKEVRFKVEPFSSLSSNRVQRGQLYKQLVDDVAIPRSMYLKELGFDDPETLQQQAVEENMKRQAMGINPPPAPGQKKSGSKK